MNCEQARALLPEHVYGDLAAGPRQELAQHLTGCPSCAAAKRDLDALRQGLDAAPAPKVRVDLAALYRDIADGERRQRRRWRRLAWTATAAAALLLIAFGLRIELRWHDREIVVGWGLPPNPAPAAAVIEPPAVPPTLLTEFQLVKDLIHALAADVEQRDQQRLEALTALERRLDTATAMSNNRWNATQNNVRALYTAYFGTREKGATP
jgi:anti-sigma factor RsiW